MLVKKARYGRGVQSQAAPHFPKSFSDKHRQLWLACTALTAFAAPQTVMAQTTVVWDGSESTDWFDPDNWNGGTVPDGTVAVEVGNTATNPLVLQGNATAGRFDVGDASASSQTQVTITGAATTLNAFQVNMLALNADATLTISGGAQVFGNNIANVSSGAGHTATLIVEGTGTRFGHSYDLRLGGRGDTNVIVRDGAVLSTGGGAYFPSSASPGFRPRHSVTVSGPGSQWLLGGELFMGFSGEAFLTIENGGFVHSSTGIVRAEDVLGEGARASVVVRGTNSLWIIDNQLQIGESATGVADVTLSQSAEVRAASTTLGPNGTLNIGAASGAAAVAAGTLTTPTVTIANADSRVVFNHTDTGYTFSPTLAGVGQVRVENGTTIFGEANSYSGVTTIAGGRLNIRDASALGAATGGTIVQNGGSLELQGGISVAAEALTLNGNGLANGGALRNISGDNGYAGPIMLGSNARISADAGRLDLWNVTGNGHALTVGGAGAVSFNAAITGISALTKVGSGTATLAWNNAPGSDFTAGINVSGGTLLVDGTVGDATARSTVLTVAGAGTLGGTGTFLGNVTVSGGALSPGGAGVLGTLTIAGNLDIAAGSSLNFDFGAPGPNFNTPGQGDHIVVGGNLAIGQSTLNVTNAGGMGPGLYNLFKWSGTLSVTGGGILPPQGDIIQVITGSKQINLIVTQGLTLNLWNANGQASSSTMGGGSGTWSVDSRVWADTAGQFTGPMIPQPGFAIFGGEAGTVTVDGSAGAVSAMGMQFVTDGYSVVGDSLSLIGQGTDAPVIRAGDGVTAIIDTVLTGSSGINKTDAGTVVLTGQNLYSGGTILSGGTLSVSSDGNLGDGAGALDFRGGTLRVTGASYHGTTRSILWGNAGGGFDIADQANSFTVQQALTGTGGLMKTGAGTLVLTGANSYSGGTTVAAGTLQGDSDSLQGNIIDNATLVFAQGTDGSFAGTISGSGRVIKTGAGTLVLAGTNSYGGGTTVADGTLQGDSDSLQGNIVDNATLVFAQGANGSFAGTISGSGQVIKTGAGTLTLTGANSYAGGTAVEAGTLVGNVAAIRGGIANAGTVVFDQAADASFAGAIAGLGGVDGAMVKRGAGALTLTGVSGLDWTVEGGSLTSSADRFTGDVAVAAGAGFTFDQASDSSYAGTISGDGSLIKTGAGTLVLTGANGYRGGTTVAAGTLQGDSDSLQGNIVDNATLVFAQGTDGSLTGSISGSGRVIKTGVGTLTLTGANSYAGGTAVEAGMLVGNVDAIRGDIANAGTVMFDQAADANFAGAIAGLNGVDGTMEKRGAGALTLTGVSGLDWAVDGGHLTSSADRFTGDVAVAAGAGFIFDQANDSSYAGTISGNGSLTKAGVGTLALTGDSGGFGGATRVEAGRLQLDGSLAGALTIESGAALVGTGTAGTVAIADGGRLIGRYGTTLSMDQLTLGSGATIDVSLGMPSTAALFDVGGDLTLDGTLDVHDAGGFGAGVYRLFDYGGSLTDAGLEIGGVPDGIAAGDLFIQTSVSGRVSLVSSAGVDLLFWDGGATSSHDNGIVEGGAGTWRADGRNWTDANGLVNGAMRPKPGFAVFQGTGGAVILDGSAGDLSVTGLQFAAGGYNLTGDALGLAGNGGRTVIRVGDGSAAGASFMATIGAALTGGSDLVKTDLGTLILTGANSYDGDTLVESGTLVGSVAAIRGDIANAGTVMFDQAADASFAGTVTGLAGADGAMVKRGAGALTLTGVSALDWAVEGGSLTSSADRFTGDVAITSGARFAFDQASDANYAGAISGGGNFTKSGTGALTLTGDSSGFDGVTSVLSGVLFVNGALGGALEIGSGGRLGGGGHVGTTTIAAGGVVAPGNSIGTLTVNGDLTLGAGSRYEVEVDPSGDASDLIHVTGHATLGGTVAHIGMDGGYRPSATYTILTADGGLSGSFEGVTSSYAFLDPSLSYSSSSVMLTLRRNDIRFCGVGLTANQCATGNGAESLGFGSPIYDAIVVLDVSAARDAFDQLSGEVHASTRSALLDDSRFVREAAASRLRHTIGGLAQPGGDDTDGPVAESGLSVWGHGFGSWGTLDGAFDAGTGRLHRSTGGLIAGLDGALGEEWRVGLIGGYSRTSLRVRGRSSSATADNIHAGVYAGGQLGAIGLRFGAAYSWSDLDTRRTVAFTGFAPETLDADYHAETAQAFGEIGYRIEVTDGAFEPFANIAWVHLRTNGFTETGGAAALSGNRSTGDIGVSTIGMRASGRISGGVDLYGSMGWRRTFGDRTPRLAEAFAGGDTFVVTGNPLARDAAAFEAGIDRSVAKGLSLGVSYSGQISRRIQDHGVKGSIRWSF